LTRPPALGVFVVRHRRGGRDLVIEQEVHVERLLDQRQVLVSVDVIFVEGGEELELVPTEPDGDLLAPEVVTVLIRWT